MPAPARISARELAARMASGEHAVIVDVRSAEEYRGLHAKGARLLPLEEVSAEKVTECVQAAGGDAGDKLYFICHSGRRATDACERVLGHFPEAAVIDGGTLAWAQAGLPVVHGDAP